MRTYFAFIAEEVMRERLEEARREALVRQARGDGPQSGLVRRLENVVRGVRDLAAGPDPIDRPAAGHMTIGRTHH
jgi:hypothetical protein